MSGLPNCRFDTPEVILTPDKTNYNILLANSNSQFKSKNDNENDELSPSNIKEANKADTIDFEKLEHQIEQKSIFHSFICINDQWPDESISDSADPDASVLKIDR